MPRPTRSQILRRRFGALIAATVLVAIGVWAATAAIDKVKKGSGATQGSVPVLATYKIVFPEGFTRAAMADRIQVVDEIAQVKRKIHPLLASSDYLDATSNSLLPAKYALDKKARTLEGFLFPSTYDLFEHDTAPVLIRKQLTAFRQAWGSIGLKFAKAKNLTEYDVLIIASMIEKEAVVDSERPLIAAVIYNRLHGRMPLAIDSTIRYALNVPGTRSLTASELRDPTPYNTRIHRGLPPGPISNPGLPSMKAAAHPANVDYLYFVAKPDKRHHFFTADAAAFQAYLASHGYGPHP